MAEHCGQPGGDRCEKTLSDSGEKRVLPTTLNCIRYIYNPVLDETKYEPCQVANGCLTSTK